MMRVLLQLIITSISFGLYSQHFQPDEFGHVSSREFNKFITQREYKLVGNFYKIHVGQKSMLVAKVLKGDQWIFISENGKEIENPVKLLRSEQNMPELTYTSADTPPESKPGLNDWKSEKWVHIRSDQGKGFVYDGDTIANAVYQQITIDPARRILIVKKDNKFGILDEKGNQLIPEQYDYLSTVNKGTDAFCFYAEKEGKTGVISCKNQVTIPFEFEEITYRETYFETRTKLGRRVGVIDLKGRTILPNAYNGIDGSHKGYFIVTILKKNNKLIGMTDGSGKFVVDTLYSDYREYDVNGFLVQFDQTLPNPSRNISGVFDLSTGKFVFTPERYGISPVIYLYGREVHERTNKGYLRGWASMNGKLLIAPQYEELQASSYNAFLVARKDKYGIVDTTGKVLIPFKYEKLEQLGSFTFETDLKRSDVFVITELGKQGIINIQQRLIIPLEYESVNPTSNGIICKKGELTAIVNLDGNEYFQTKDFQINESNLSYGIIKTRDFTYDLYGNKLPVKR